MNQQTNGKPQPPDDSWVPACFFENQLRFPPQELQKYAGKHIAWSWDGSWILASADEIDDLHRQLEKAGIPFSRTVFAYVDPLETTNC